MFTANAEGVLDWSAHLDLQLHPAVVAAVVNHVDGDERRRHALHAPVQDVDPPSAGARVRNLQAHWSQSSEGEAVQPDAWQKGHSGVPWCAAHRAVHVTDSDRPSCTELRAQRTMLGCALGARRDGQTLADERTLAQVSAWMSKWSGSHSGHWSVIWTTMERSVGLAWQLPTRSPSCMNNTLSKPN